MTKLQIQSKIQIEEAEVSAKMHSEEAVLEAEEKNACLLCAWFVCHQFTKF